MQTVTAAQIRAARAMLHWTRKKLSSASGVAVGTIKAIELETYDPGPKTQHKLVKAFILEGLCFTDCEGVRKMKSSHHLPSQSEVRDAMQTLRSLMQTVGMTER